MKVMLLAAIAALSLSSAARASNGQTLASLTPYAGDFAGARLPLDLSDHHASLTRPLPDASAVEDPVENRTAIDHRFAPAGLVGQAGYLCGIGGIGPDTDATRGGPASAFGHFGTFLGASLGYAFK